MLELRNINKVFGEKQILSNFSLKIPEKQILAIVGPSGGGKTTLLRMLAGLETIDSGQIFYNGESSFIRSRQFDLIARKNHENEARRD